MDPVHSAGPRPPAAAPRAAAALVTAHDRHLIDGCLKGQPGAWEDFVGRFAGLLVFVIDRTCGQRGATLTAPDRDDVLADILLEILHRDAAVLRGFSGRSSLATYLTVVARRVVVRSLGRLADQGRLGRHLADRQAPERGDDGERRLADREQVELLLGRLEATEARLVRLHHLESRSYGEISLLTGMPLGSIGPTLARAREKMKHLQQ